MYIRIGNIYFIRRVKVDNIGVLIIWVWGGIGSSVVVIVNLNKIYDIIYCNG